MTDTTPPTPEPTPYAEPTPYTAPVGAPAGKSPILSIISLVAGILGILGFAIVFIPFIGSILGIPFPLAAVILGFLGKSKEPFASKGLWLTGIILGAVGLLIAVVAFIGWALAVAASGSYTTY